MTAAEPSLNGRRRAPCTVCGRPPHRAYRRSYHGEVTCASHPVAAVCTFCTRPTDVLGEGWLPLGPGVLRCPRCRVGAIDRHEDARRALPAVRRQLDAIGFALRRRVRVHLVDDAALRAMFPEIGPAPFGVTRIALAGTAPREVLDVSVLAGLPDVWFGRVVAHENMHAWMVEQQIEPTTVAVAEGLCELAAYGWLKGSGSALAEPLRSGICLARDPTYGDGFRQVQAAVRAHSLATVIDHLRRTSTLP